MNERIKELWDEAAKLEPDPSWAGQTRFMEKFAELIVQECAELVDRAISDGGVDGRVVKEHFGVEE
jgi:hypothetical protein